MGKPGQKIHAVVSIIMEINRTAEEFYRAKIEAHDYK